MIRPGDPDATVRELLRKARPASVDAARAARVRPAVHAAWKEASSGTRHWKRGLTLAAAALLVVAVALTVVNRLSVRGTPQESAPVASTLFGTSEVVFQHNGQARAGSVGEELLPGTRITTHGGRAAIVLANGVELRLDADTDITLDTERSMSLARGALYLDSSYRTGPPETVAIVARGTVIRDIGTRYEVRVSDHELRVRVRDGRVEVLSAFGLREADRGGQLRVTSTEILSGKAPTAGADWDWIVRATRPPQLEGRPLPEFLDWAEREGGRSIRFADPELERANAATIVYGAIERLTVDEALDVVLSSCGLARRTDEDVITIVAADDAIGVSKAK
ncbi:MAG TPA: FecR domain-containing protein [Vicinamibacterales bacterium]|nr:FecR domain-containing protein [Vicinamibacterales bacterium]